MLLHKTTNGAVQVPPRFRLRKRGWSLGGILVLLVAVLGIGTITMTPSGAEADLVITGANGPAHSYIYPNPTSQRMRDLPNGTPVHAICQDYGTTTRANGVRSNVWILLLNPAGNGVGSWVSAHYVSVSNRTGFSPELGVCGAPSSGPVSAYPPAAGALASLSRAAGQVGQKNSPAGHTWAGWCSNFTAFVNGLGHSGYFTAMGQWEDSVKLGLAHPGDAVPPWGALVFFTSTSDPRGHVAYSLGGGSLISTPGLKGQPVYMTSIAQFQRYMKYLGWAYPHFTA